MVFGMTVGVVMDLHRLSRILFGVRYSPKTFEAWYQKPLPLIHRPLRPIRQGRLRRLCLPILMFVQDVLLFVFAAVGTVILNYYFNQGRFRLYTVLAVLLGFLIYYGTVGRLVMLVSEGIVLILRSVCTVIFVLFSRPICLFVGFFGKNAKKTVKNLGNAIAKKRKRVYNKHKKNKIMRQSEQGFLDPHA